MSTVTGGVVSIEDGLKKPEEYAPARKVRVELHFDVAEDLDAQAVIRAVSDLAQEEVTRQLGAPKGKPGRPPAKASIPEVAPAPEPAPAMEQKVEADKGVTDQELTAACARHNDKIKNPPAIRELAKKHGSVSGRAGEIPAGSRKLFLAELSALT